MAEALEKFHRLGVATLCQGDPLATIDIRDAYLHVPFCAMLLIFAGLEHALLVCGAPLQSGLSSLGVSKGAGSCPAITEMVGDCCDRLSG